MVKRRALEAAILSPIGCHTFRATGITQYLKNGGKLEHAQQIAAHESPLTTKLYDRRKTRPEDSPTFKTSERTNDQTNSITNYNFLIFSKISSVRPITCAASSLEKSSFSS